MASRAVLVLLAALAASSAQAQERTLKLGTEGAYPPFNNLTADGRLEGFDIDIGNALCEQMKAKCEWVTQDWDGIIPALQSGKFDAIVASMFITDERKQQVDFTDKYYNTPPAVAVPKDSPIAGVTPQDLAGKTVGVQSSTTYANYAQEALTESEIRSYPSAQEMQADLANGRLDAMNDDVVVIEKFLQTPEGGCCKVVGTMEPDPKIHGPGAGIAVRKGDPLAAELNAAIKAIRANGTYKEINDKYFPFDVYGSNP